MNSAFTDETTLAEQTENLGQMAMLMGLTPNSEQCFFGM